MEPRIRMVMAPTHSSTLLLVMDKAEKEILRARLAPPSQIHRRAAMTLLEGLSLWCQKPLSVVLFVDNEAVSSGLHLSDGFGFGDRTVFYDVEVIEKQKPGFPDFSQLRRVCRRRAS